MTQSANDLLFSGGLPSISFKDASIGTAFKFTIQKVNEPRQQTDLMDGTQKFWDDGRPMMTVPVDILLKPGTFTPSSPTDRGDRSWWIPVGSQMHSATRDAVRQAQAQGLQAGADVVVTLAGEEPNKRGKGNPKKIYAVEYTPGNPGSDALMATPGQQPSAVPAPAQSAAQGAAPTDPALQAALSQLTPEQRAKLGIPNF